MGNQGTTWTQEIVDLLLHNGDAEFCKRAPTPVRSPFLELFSPPPIPSGVCSWSYYEGVCVWFLFTCFKSSHLWFSLWVDCFYLWLSCFLSIKANSPHWSCTSNLILIMICLRSGSSVKNGSAENYQDTPSFSTGASWILGKQVQSQTPHLKAPAVNYVLDTWHNARKWCERLTKQCSPQVTCSLYCCCKSLQTIYVARNAKDNMVSYFHFDKMNMTQPEPGPWDGYVHKFMRGECKQINSHSSVSFYIETEHLSVNKASNPVNNLPLKKSLWWIRRKVTFSKRISTCILLFLLLKKRKWILDLQ